MTEETLSTQPYLIRALWQWANDSGFTPQLLVDAGQPGVQVPAASVQDGQVVLNVSDHAVSNLDLGNETIRFSARFGGVARTVSFPVSAVRAIFSRENGQGMAFESLPEEGSPKGVGEAQDVTPDKPTKKNTGPPKFTVVK